jgi:jumonji domain-containing protein 7
MVPTAERRRNADSPTKSHNGELVFVKPWEEQQSFEEFINFISAQARSGAKLDSVQEVRYAQTREHLWHSRVKDG